MKKRVLVCLTGASGAIYGVRLLRALKSNGHEVHLIVSKWGEETLKYETGIDSETLKNEADFFYNEQDLAAGPASGTFPIDSMVVIPCSMKTLQTTSLLERLIVALKKDVHLFLSRENHRIT
jgi:polyprenyl P-hydroxybenzoate/phenylacrylic acid decarboxylase-like protein